MDTESASTVSQLLETFKEHPFLRGLSESHLLAIGETAMQKEFEKGELIFREGDPANRFYLILEGKVALESRRGNDEPILIQEIGAGDVLGWSWLFPPHVWQFDARASATERTKAIFFYGTRLREQCEVNPALGYELMKRITRTVIERLQATRNQLIEKTGRKPGAAIRN